MAIANKRLLSIGLRFGTLSTRFIFVFFLAKYLDVASVGYYGLFIATVGYFLYFVGMDFYIYVTREVLQVPAKHRGKMIKGQIALSGIMYIILTPIFIVFVTQVNWPNSLVWWLFPILLLEHFNQEVSRFLVAMSEQVFASIVLFVRQGSWSIVLLGLMTWNADSRNLSVVMAFWACASIIAAMLGFWKIRCLQIGGWQEAIDWRWVRKGIAVSGAFLIGTLALRGIQTIDRYWLEALAGIEIVGAYIVFVGIAGALMAFLDAGIFSFGYPELITYNHRKDYTYARIKVLWMFYQTVAVCLSFGIVSWLVLPYLLAWIGKAAYANAISLYPWVLIAMIINAIGMVPHYGLYSAGNDKPIVYSHLMALPIFVLTVFVSGYFQLIYAVPAGLVAAFTSIFIWKTIAYLKMVLNQNVL